MELCNDEMFKKGLVLFFTVSIEFIWVKINKNIKNVDSILMHNFICICNLKHLVTLLFFQIILLQNMNYLTIQEVKVIFGGFIIYWYLQNLNTVNEKKGKSEADNVEEMKQNVVEKTNSENTDFTKNIDVADSHRHQKQSHRKKKDKPTEIHYHNVTNNSHVDNSVRNHYEDKSVKTFTEVTISLVPSLGGK